MESKLKIIIVDDHDMFREGVKVLLGKSQKTQVIGEAANGKEFLTLIEKLNPDVVLMDISMPVMDGIEASRLAVQNKPDIKILTLSMFGDEEYYYKMIQSGVRGFVMKSAGIDELEHAINQVAGGSAYFSEELMDIVKQNISRGNLKESEELSCAEISILKALALNQSDTEIAREMKLGMEEINQIRSDLFQKTGSINTSGLIMFAIKNKLIKI